MYFENAHALHSFDMAIGKVSVSLPSKNEENVLSDFYMFHERLFAQAYFVPIFEGP